MDRKIHLSALWAAVVILASCAAPRYIETSSPEESGLNLMKITDENSISVAGSPSVIGVSAANMLGRCSEESVGWWPGRCLDISPDGKELAYMSKVDNSWNVMIRKSGAQGAATQRTFRMVNDFSWGSDEKLYFADASNENLSQISSTDAHIGTIMRQLTNNNQDMNPVLSKDGKKLYFTRIDRNGPFVWSYDIESGALTSCCKGFNPWPTAEGEFLCVRNSSNTTSKSKTSTNSEIWLVNYEKGTETLIVSDKKRGFTNPTLSPDGRWILCQGNSKSTISKKNNLDIFAIRIDGTQFIQLTYHPADDCSPVWSEDGKYIYFISSRANKDNAFNIWRMKFNL